MAIGVNLAKLSPSFHVRRPLGKSLVLSLFQNFHGSLSSAIASCKIGAIAVLHPQERREIVARFTMKRSLGIFMIAGLAVAVTVGRVEESESHLRD